MTFTEGVNMTFTVTITDNATVARATEKARALLFRYLTPEQQREYLHGAAALADYGSLRGFVTVTSQSGRRFLVSWDHCYELRGKEVPGCLGRHYCAWPQGLPPDDILLAKILALKYREEKFFSVAR